MFLEALVRLFDCCSLADLGFVQREGEEKSWHAHT